MAKVREAQRTQLVERFLSRLLRNELLPSLGDSFMDLCAFNRIPYLIELSLPAPALLLNHIIERV